MGVAAGFGHGGRVGSSPATDLRGFDPRETHCARNRRGWSLHASSAALGWRNLFVSSQTEIPEEADYGSARHHLLVVHRTGPASVSLRMGGRSTVKQVAAGASTFCPGGEGFTVRIFDTVDSANIYLRHELIERVIDERAVATAAPQMPVLRRRGSRLVEHLVFACVAGLDNPSNSPILRRPSRGATAAHLVETHGLVLVVPSAGRYPGLTDRQLRRAEEYMIEHMDGDLAVEDLAAAAG